jgi:hypothetical protein
MDDTPGQLRDSISGRERETPTHQLKKELNRAKELGAGAPRTSTRDTKIFGPPDPSRNLETIPTVIGFVRDSIWWLVGGFFFCLLPDMEWN